MDKIASEVLDESFRTALAGDSKDFRESSSSLMFAFILALILIFLVLSAQFESFKDPLIVMMTVPLALTGALLFMWYFNITMNIFSQIGIIMLIGLVSKNGILIVEFANQRKSAGMSKIEAIKYACCFPFQANTNDKHGNNSWYITISSRIGRRCTEQGSNGYCSCWRIIFSNIPILVCCSCNIFIHFK